MAAASTSDRLAHCFADLRQAGKKAFIVYLTAGDPDLDTTVELVCGMAEAGVDCIELGIPFTDPMADGPVIQAAAERALDAGATVKGVLKAVRKIRKRTQIPLIFFTYMNPIVAYGIDAFARDAVAAGVDALLPLDLPPEEDGEIMLSLRQAGLANVCLIAPNTTPDRRRMLARESRGFVYYVCRYGVTGERDSLPKDLSRQLKDLRSKAEVPVCVGFGIKSPEQAATAARYGDGVIIGSHLVQMVHDLRDDKAMVKKVVKRAGLLADAVHGAGR